MIKGTAVNGSARSKAALERLTWAGVARPRRPMPGVGWEERAACRGADVELFFSADERDQQRALAYCAVCEVRQECLETAIANGESFGIWGGLVESDRRAYVRGIWYRRRTPTPPFPGSRLRFNGPGEGAAARRRPPW